MSVHLQPQNGTTPLLAGSESMRKLDAIISQVATTDATVLIQGESGVGKGLIAKVLHARSLRRERPFVNINCAALPAELLESELFGYDKGAFTGAHRRKAGKFEMAHKGTIFLDEIGELPLPLQAKLLQVLHDGEYSRLGDENTVQVDVQILAATNRNLEQAVQAGTFRSDLYYRLNVVNITVPPLRERQEEISQLTSYFLQKYSKQYKRPLPILSVETLKLFQAYHWPGNIRQLENYVKRIIILGSEEFVGQELIAEDTSIPSPPSCGLGLKELSRRAARQVECKHIQQTLVQTQWNRVQAAKLLQVSYRTLLYKMEECGLSSAKEKMNRSTQQEDLFADSTGR
jgi:two-component system response regulator AtoC